MKITSRSGFSLVELLTVIAIIAILAAIIFPVMATVKERANQASCMTNLHQIAMAVQMFKQDNRKYPEILGSEVKAGPGGVEMFENAKDRYLFPEYVKTIKAFHCPSSRITNSRDHAEYPIPTRTENIKVYAFDSYDYHVVGFAGAKMGNFTVYSNIEPHYVLKWADSPDAIMGSGLLPYPPDEANDISTAQRDYERQLRFRTPPADTVVTWCAYHQGTNFGGKTLVVFLDGHTDSYPADEFKDRKWRVRPKKG